MIHQRYVQVAKVHTGIKKGERERMLTINYDLVTLQEAVFLLSNHNGYLDGDKQQLVIKL